MEIEDFITNIDKLTLNEFLHLKKEIEDRQPAFSLISTLKSVRNKKIVEELDYNDPIEQIFDSFNVFCNLSSNNRLSFFYMKKDYAKGSKWTCLFDKAILNMDSYSESFGMIQVIHIPSDLRFGKRIEISFDVLYMNSPIDLIIEEIKKIGNINEIQTLGKNKTRLLVRFEDAECLSSILLILKDFAEKEDI